MHIEPGVVAGAKLLLGAGTAAAAAAFVLPLALASVARRGVARVALRSAIGTAAVLACFELLPSTTAGVSEVHFVFGSALFLLIGTVPAAVALALGLLVQGVLFAPSDLPQYGMNVTTLVVPLLALGMAARRIVAPGTAWADLRPTQVLALSATYQGGVVAWVAFWVIWGEGATAAALAGLAAFAVSYGFVLLAELLVDLLLLAAVRAGRDHGLTAALTDAHLRRDEPTHATTGA